MFVNVYVDDETFHYLLFNRKSFDACLQPGKYASICLTVPVDSIYESSEPGIVVVSRNKNS